MPSLLSPRLVPTALLTLGLFGPLGCVGGSGESESASDSASNSNSNSNSNSDSNSSSGSESDTASASGKTTGTTADLSGTDVTGSTTEGTTGGTTEGTTEGTTGGWPDWCNYYDMFCPEGTKCTFDGDVGVVQCVEIIPDPKQLGDACDPGEGGSFDGIDDCDDNLLCWESSPDGPICVPFCGEEDDFTCELGMTCTTCQTCALGICIPDCDPLGDECQEGDVCVPLSGSNGFGCALDASMDKGAYLDECEYVNVCDPGLVCLDADNLPGCEGNGCCSPFCDLNDPVCPDDQLVCTAWFEPEQAPEDLKHLGVCVLPDP